MALSVSNTRERLVAAAAKLFYAEGIKSVGVDAVAEAAGVTKRTLYYHFDSKDALIAAYLEERDQPNLALFQRWFGEAEGDVAIKIKAIFDRLARSTRHPKWRGCGFLRTAAELANMPGHPAMRAAALHKRRVEDWLAGIFEQEGVKDARQLARQVILLLDGAFSVVLLHRDSTYLETAGGAAAALIATAPRR
ncbi:helix-turn-helix domain-containing protein [Rhizobium sp. T1470]|uniref:TetR/AcrR family transcriptional regulator n=1 Tax=unclassified Rhizobium TaxID=2613769 RepID=UPI001AAFBD4D|nr:TetR/AcrR family transcriptional regulator [Rhizobium sp. T1473]MCA0800546.1 TetR/AcrR family transcriptional regulator [Rhizobium sp. T1473]